MRAKRTSASLIRTNAVYLALLLAVYVSGIVLGSLAIPALTHAQRTDLASYLDLFIRGVTRDSGLSGSEIFRVSVLSQLKTAALIWVLGITIIGVPLVLVIVFIRGFVSGFTVGFMSLHLGAKGLVLAGASIVPHSLVSVPVFLIISVASLTFASSIVRQSMQHRKVAFMTDLVQYTAVGAVGLAALVVSSLIEAYLTPALVRAVSTFFVL